MKSKLLVFLLIIFSGIDIFPHNQNMHQYITREAFKLLKKSFPNMLSEMEAYIGTNEKWAGSSADGSFGALKVVSGSWLEDEYDVVYGYGLTIGPDYRDNQNQAIPINTILSLFNSFRAANTSITHFWNGDDGENAYTRLSDNSNYGYWTLESNKMLCKKCENITMEFMISFGPIIHR